MEIDLPIKNFEAQQTIFDSPARYKIVSKGRRFGLTRGAAHDFIKSAIEKKFKQGLWVDTVNSNIDRYVERYFMPALKKLPENMWNWRKQAKILHIHKSYIDFRSADRPENLEGFGYDKIFINEAGIVLKNDYLWHNAIAPMMWDFQPSVVIGGTPKGKGLFWELSERGKDKEQEDYAFFHFTSFDNPFLPKKVMTDEIKTMPDRVREQEVYARFMDDTGIVFRNIKTIATARFEKPKQGRMYVMGVDLAKHQDYTVIAVYDRQKKEQVYQYRFNKLDWPTQKKRIKETSRHFNRAVVYIDATGLGDPIVDDLVRDGIPVEPVKFTNQSKKELIEKMVIFIEQERIKIIPIEETINEFTNFTYDITSSGRVSYNAPQGFHDDIVIAHCLAVSSLYEPVQVRRPKSKSGIAEEFSKRLKEYQEEQDEDPYAHYA